MVMIEYLLQTWSMQMYAVVYSSFMFWIRLAAGQGFKWTKYPIVRKFHRISSERFFKLLDSIVYLEMKSDSKNCVCLQDDEIMTSFERRKLIMQMSYGRIECARNLFA